MSHALYHARMAAAALPRWERIAKARKAGRKLREIPAEEGIDTAMVHRLEQKFYTYTLNQRKT